MESQAHDGLVTTGTPSVQYTYADGATGNVAKYVRLEQVTYPDGDREIDYNYAAGVDSIMSRLSSISDNQSGFAADAVYTYLGLGTIVKTAHSGVSGGLNLDYDPDGDNSFSGFDRFARVVDQLWANNAGAPIDQYKYGYDRAGNRTWKQNAAAVGKALDELYAYDNLDRLTNTQRGALSFNPLSITNSSHQTWTLDGLGNFAALDDNGTPQPRGVNAANEITSTTGIATPTYDAAGNMTGDGTLKYQYDAWKRQVRVYQSDGTTLVATYQYDGQNHRTTKTLADTTKTDYFYDSQWQVVEERTGAAVNQYVWDQSYIDAPVVRFHDATGGGTYVAQFYTWDANHNVTATINTSATVTGRVVYDSYGKATVYDEDWTTNLGDPAEDGPLYCGYWFDFETGNDLARNRYYSVTLATWFIPDPIGYDVNLYRYCYNNPVIYVDPSGLWGHGNAEGSGNGSKATRGHSDFPSYTENGQILFDWTLEDRGDTRPLPDITTMGWRFNSGVHFRSLHDSEKDMADACKSCNLDKFIRAGHDMQDFFSHYGQGYRWVPGQGSLGHGPGTVIEGRIKPPVGMSQTPPDDAEVYSAAWQAAYDRTQIWVDRWNNCCEKDDKGNWKPKCPQPRECGEGRPMGYENEEAPKPTPIPGYWSRFWGAIEGWFADEFSGWNDDAIYRYYGINR